MPNHLAPRSKESIFFRFRSHKMLGWPEKSPNNKCNWEQTIWGYISLTLLSLLETTVPVHDYKQWDYPWCLLMPGDRGGGVCELHAVDTSIPYQATDWEELRFRFQMWKCHFLWSLESFLSRKKVVFCCSSTTLNLYKLLSPNSS